MRVQNVYESNESLLEELRWCLREFGALHGTDEDQRLTDALHRSIELVEIWVEDMGGGNEAAIDSLIRGFAYCNANGFFINTWSGRLDKARDLMAGTIESERAYDQLDTSDIESRLQANADEVEKWPEWQKNQVLTARDLEEEKS